MGVDLENGGQVSVEDVLARWDPVDDVSGVAEGSGELVAKTSTHRSNINPLILGLSESALDYGLSHLDVGDALELAAGASEAEKEGSDGAKARQALLDVLSGRHVLVSKETNEEGPVYGPWSTRYCGHQFGSWAGQLGDGRAISLIETESPSGERTEIQLKGGGRTPFSRQADGLAVLRSGVREFLGSEGESRCSCPLFLSFY